MDSWLFSSRSDSSVRNQSGDHGNGTGVVRGTVATPSTFFFVAIAQRKSGRKETPLSGSAPDPRHLLKKVDENFIPGQAKEGAVAPKCYSP